MIYTNQIIYFHLNLKFNAVLSPLFIRTLIIDIFSIQISGLKNLCQYGNTLILFSQIQP